ncbi:MYB DNA-binding domain protein [Aspergillus stella-maris]|uniref:MYB DNA-binding domain protein n=1 Tax=Aspergillus stella-maris TaxID=1810926 RepID=UPI003CCDCE0A
MSPSPALSTGDSQTKGRLKRANGTSNARGATGAFQPPEVEALEDFKVRFCNGNGCSLATFDLMVQHGFEGQFPSVNGITKRSFWNQVRAILPNRDKRSVYRFMKRHFQASGQKSHQWTAEQEDELVALYKQHGPKWARIADEIGRSADDVVQRFKNRLEHRDTMNTGPWSDAEFDLMKTALRGAWSRLGEQGYDVGANIYEMDESLISWGQISTSMKHIRSRQQCADKWRGVKTTMTSLPGSQVNSRANSRSVSRSATPSSAQQPKGRRSDAWVRPGDDDSDAPGLEADKEAKNPTPAASSPLKQQNNAESSDGSSSDSEEYSTTSDSEEESESDAKAEKEPPMPTIKKEQETAPSESGSETGSSTNSDSDSDSDDSSSDGSDDEDNPKTVKVEGSDDVIPETPVVEREGASSAMSDASDSSDEESSDSE